MQAENKLRKIDVGNKDEMRESAILERSGSRPLLEIWKNKDFEADVGT